MLITWSGLGTRIVGKFTWSRQAGYTQELPAKIAADCLAQPGETFAVAESEPLRKLDGMDDAALFELAAAGIGTLAELARADAAQVERIRITTEQLTAWVQAAKKKGGA
jgi:predicted RecB family nuclease